MHVKILSNAWQCISLLSSVNMVNKYYIKYSSFFFTTKGFRNVSSIPLADENSVLFIALVCALTTYFIFKNNEINTSTLKFSDIIMYSCL